MWKVNTAGFTDKALDEYLSQVLKDGWKGGSLFSDNDDPNYRSYTKLTETEFLELLSELDSLYPVKTPEQEKKTPKKDTSMIDYRYEPDEKYFHYEFALPGISKKQINIELNPSEFKGTVTASCPDRKRSYNYSFQISQFADLGSRTVEFVDGILYLSFRRTSMSKVINVKID
jgi:HSP20 family molecular chaperone IbpA